MAEHAIQPLTSEEIALVERARRRDPEAIRLIVKQQNQKLYRIARSILRDDSEPKTSFRRPMPARIQWLFASLVGGTGSMEKRDEVDITAALAALALGCMAASAQANSLNDAQIAHRATLRLTRLMEPQHRPIEPSVSSDFLAAPVDEQHRNDHAAVDDLTAGFRHLHDRQDAVQKNDQDHAHQRSEDRPGRPECWCRR